MALFVPPTDLPETSYDESESPFTAVVSAPTVSDISVPQQRPVLISHSITIERTEIHASDFTVTPILVAPPAPKAPLALLC